MRPSVRLSDLFDEPAANADSVLGPGPGSGRPHRRRGGAACALSRGSSRVDWRPASSADRAVLERPGRPLRRDDVVEAVRSALDCRRRIGRLRRRSGRLHPAVVPLDADTAAGGLRPRLRCQQSGRFSAMLSVAGEGMEPMHMRVVGRVRMTRSELPVAATRLAAGGIVLRAERRAHGARAHLAAPWRGGAANPSDAIGMQTKRHASRRSAARSSAS